MGAVSRPDRATSCTAAFAPDSLEVEDDSARHAGHAGARRGGESHFNVVIRSARLRGGSRVQRQRMVYAAAGRGAGRAGARAVGEGAGAGRGGLSAPPRSALRKNRRPLTPFPGPKRSPSCKAHGGAHDGGPHGEDVLSTSGGLGDGDRGDRARRRGERLRRPDPVDLKVVDRETGQALRVWRHDGRLFVAGEPGARYSLRVTNHTDGRVLVVMSVDGVNILTGRDGQLRPERLCVRPARVLRRDGLAQVDHRGRRLHLRPAAAILRRAHRPARRRRRHRHGGVQGKRRVPCPRPRRRRSDRRMAR